MRRRTAWPTTLTQYANSALNFRNTAMLQATEILNASILIVDDLGAAG